MDAGGVFAIIFAILFAIIGVLYARTYAPALPSAPSVGTGAITDFLSLLVLYMPNTFFVYGFIADIINNKYHYSVASLTALCGMFINKGLGGFIATSVSFIKDRLIKTPATAAAALTAMGLGAIVAAPAVAAAAPAIAVAPVAAAVAAPATVASVAPAATAAVATTAAAATAASAADEVPSTNPFKGGAVNVCSLPGFEWLENKFAPQGIIMSMTVLWYLLIEMWDTGQGQNTIALGVTTAITFALQWFVLHSSGCLDSYEYKAWSAIVALVMAITFAGTSYGVQKVIARNISSGGSPVAPVPSGTPGTFVCPPGTVQSADATQCVTPLGPGGTQNTPTQSIINVGGKNSQTEPVDDNDQFVCEAYKDGELVTSTIVE
jgi:hypothetical protein